MHYGKSTFAKAVSQVTILPKKDPETELTPEIGQRDQLSQGDIRQTSKMYRCAGKANKTCTLRHADMNVIGHFRITFSLFLKASLGAHPFI